MKEKGIKKIKNNNNNNSFEVRCNLFYVKITRKEIKAKESKTKILEIYVPRLIYHVNGIKPQNIFYLNIQISQSYIMLGS